MSTDFISLFDAPASLTPERLLAMLAGRPGFGAGVIDKYRDFWRPKSWTIETAPVSGTPEILGPGGFAVSINPATIELYHMMPFTIFAGDPESRDALRHSCKLVAEMVGSARAIYTHELMPHDGAGLDEIERGLRAEIGPPATSFEELRDAEYFGPRAWYVDTFADLLRASGV